MSEIQKDLLALEKKHDIVIFSIQWVSPKQGHLNEWKRKTRKGVGFCKWSGDLIKYAKERTKGQ